MELKDWLSIGAFIVSLTSLTISILNNRRSAITGIKPVLVFVYNKDKGWILQNIGNGPAMNIIVAQKKINGKWFDPVRIPPISKSTEFVLTWLDHVNDTGLGATYTDFQDRAYSSTCANDLSRIFDGNILEGWKEQEIGQHWQKS
ncbi:MAG TPA: hypothetical protein VFR47_22340 [Anaerolineales bacterium]|nr:hypothetical protein [Anaerolineales bacterium]